MPVLSACTLWPDSTAADTAVLSVRVQMVFFLVLIHIFLLPAAYSRSFSASRRHRGPGYPRQAVQMYICAMLAPAPPTAALAVPPSAGRFLRGRLIPIQADTVRTFSRKKEMSGSSARHPVSQGPSAQGVNVTPKIETAGCLDDTLPVQILNQRSISSVFCLLFRAVVRAASKGRTNPSTC